MYKIARTLLPFIYRHNYGYFSGRSYCTQALGCCSIFIALQQLKVFLFPYMTNTFKAAAKVRVAPGHTSWWSSNWLNDHALSRLYWNHIIFDDPYQLQRHSFQCVTVRLPPCWQLLNQTLGHRNTLYIIHLPRFRSSREARLAEHLATALHLVGFLGHVAADQANQVTQLLWRGDKIQSVAAIFSGCCSQSH